MGGEPLIRKDTVHQTIPLFPEFAIVTNGAYGIPSVPGHLVTVSLHSPPELYNPIPGNGVFEQVKELVFARDPGDDTMVMLQMAATREKALGLEDYMAEVS